MMTFTFFQIFEKDMLQEFYTLSLFSLSFFNRLLKYDEIFLYAEEILNFLQ